MTGKNRAYWLKAAYDEMTYITQMAVFEILPNMPVGRKALPAKWVFSTKKSRDGKIIKFKARWVACSDLQKKGVDYHETFAPVANLASVRLMLKKIIRDDLELDQSDVISTFLNGDIDTIVFLRQPEGFTIGIGVCILHKSIYGLCQAARIWYEVVDETLVAIGFRRLFADQAVWVKIHSDFQCVIGHVDNLLTGGKHARVDETKAALQERFKLKDLGPANVFVGLHIVRDRVNRTITLDQIHYAKEILELYSLGDCNAVSVLMQPRTQLLKTVEDEKLPEHEIKLYQAMIGSLGYIMNCTRPDLAYAVGKVAQFALCPSAQHISAVKYIFRYLKGSLNTIHCIQGKGDSLVAYFDASWADDVNDRRSTFSYTVLYGGSAMIWKSKKHKGISLSTTDAEYLATTETTRNICWIRNIFAEAKLDLPIPVVLRDDNINTNALVSSTSTNNRTRHIDIKHRFVTEKASEGLIKIEWVTSDDQTADIFTKPLPRESLLRHAKSLGLCFDDPHRCSICLTAFASNNFLHKHIRTSHPTEGTKTVHSILLISMITDTTSDIDNLLISDEATSDYTSTLLIILLHF